MTSSRTVVSIAALALLGAAMAVAQSNLAAASAGGRLVAFASQYNDSDWAAANLIDGSASTSWSGRSAGPQAVVLGFRDDGLVELEDVVINPFSRESVNNWAREVEIQVSTTFPFRGFRSAGRLKLEPEGSDQVFSFDGPTPARYLKIVFLSNGGGGYLQAAEIRALGRPVAGAPAAPAYRALHTDATIERFASQYNETDWAAANLLAADGVPGQWAGKGNGPQEVVVALAREATVTDVAINNYARESPNNWALRAEIQLSATSAYKGFTAAEVLAMPPVGDLHVLTLAQPTPARWVKVLFRSNGGGGYMEADRIRIFAAEGAEAEAGIASQLEATGRAVTRDILFAFNSAEILPASEPALVEIATVLRNQSGLELIIEGHTDGVGTPEANLELSRRRAEAVKRWLVDRLGIGETRLTTVGYGLTRPVADNATDEGRARNRRVELVRKD